MGSHSSKNIPFSRIPKYDLTRLAVITVLFNPIKYKSRYELYHKFDEHMTCSRVTLLTVECIFDCANDFDLPQQKFEITRQNDRRHLQIRAPSVLWLKENLINIAISRLPSQIEYVAWLDADIEFERLDWPRITIHQLQHYSIVQLFDLSFFLGPAGKKEILREDYSFAYAIRHDLQLDAQRSSKCNYHPGYAWAMRRNVFEKMGGLLEFSILGSGDLHFAYALINRIDETIPPGMHNDYKTAAKIWGQRVAQLAGNGASVGYVPVHIRHYWHGNRDDRGYFQRLSILQDHQYSPLRDLENNSYNGLLRFNERRRNESADETKRLNSLEKAIISYFQSRKEDNLKKSLPSFDTMKTREQPSSDVLQPNNPLPRYSQTSHEKNMNQLPNESHEYIPLEDTHSGYLSNDMNSTQLYNDESADRNYNNQDLRSQFMYSDQENQNIERLSLTEVSF